MTLLDGVPSGRVLEAVRTLCGLEVCWWCEGLYLEGEGYYLERQEESVCVECAGSCEWCNETVCRHELETMDHAGGSSYALCNGCQGMPQCCDCDGFIDPDSDSYVRSVQSYLYCEGCAEGLNYCEQCGEYSSSSRGCSSCECCTQCGCHCDPDESSGRVIHDYSFKPFPYFYGVGPLYVGLELEIECGNATESKGAIAQDVVESFGGLVYCKNDSSLNDGFEIVTHPMSPHYFGGLEVFDQVVRGLAAKGCRSWQGHTCGFHVHLSKRAFRSRVHLFAFSLFFYRNREAIRAISGRRESELDRYASLTLHQGQRACHEPRLIDKVRGRSPGLRMAAVNLQNSSTVEIRFFRGSLRPETLRGAVDLCVAVFEYSAGLTSSNVKDGGLDWSLFRAWLDRGRFVHLLDLCDRRGV